ncbi:MAG: hypothetical protein J1E82_05660 [Muribaculaceae bacterium]|nr:hypothetical protein [Muribaculaceae bacterium]
MKKLLYLALGGMILLATGCNNDDITIDTDTSINEVAVSVSLQNLFSSYDFVDTYHNITQIQERYRTFHSEAGKYIHIRTLFYNSNGNLVDSIVDYSSTTNTLNKTINLSEGKYTVVSILNFADGEDYELSRWYLCDKEKLSTAFIKPYNRGILWSIMSYDSKTITVEKGKTTTVSLNPSPVGALCYGFFQDFQYKNEATYPTIGDNDIRQIAIYSRSVADGYYLDPNAVDKYIYFDDPGYSGWYFLSNRIIPEDFASSKDYGYFRTDLISYFYILNPSSDLCFGCKVDGATGFFPYGENHYTIQDGKTYLAYWDWFKVGEPYFGIANNNHWNTYSTKSRSEGFEDMFELDLNSNLKSDIKEIKN